MKGSLGEDENFFINAKKPSSSGNSARYRRQEHETGIGRLFGAGTVWEVLGSNVGHVVRIGDKPFPASKEGQHTICPLPVDKKPVVRTRRRCNGEGTWSEIVGGESGDGLPCERIRSLGLFTLAGENIRQVVSKRSAAGFLREIRDLGHRGAARSRQNNRQS